MCLLRIDIDKFEALKLCRRLYDEVVLILKFSCSVLNYQVRGKQTKNKNF